MARLASEEKGGYYPTPPLQVELIAGRLRVEPETKVNIFDPCAGEGDALLGFADALRKQGAEVITYGIELEQSRAEKARKKLDHVIWSAYEEARVTPHSMSFMWLNPPYNNRNGVRAEAIFLRDLTDPTSGKLQPGGLLGFCIPQYVLKDTASLLAIRFGGIHVYRFAGADFYRFKQVVVFGYRLPGKNPDYVAEKQRLERLAYDNLPPLDVDDGVTFTIPPAACEVATFKGGLPDAGELREAVLKSPVWSEAELLYKTRTRNVMMGRPVLPLKPTHMAVAIAAGAVGGHMGSHLLVGTTKRTMTRQEIPDENGTLIVEVYESRSTVRVFCEKGVFVLE